MNNPHTPGSPLPSIQPELHLSEEQLSTRFATGIDQPKDVGTVTLLVARPASGMRILPDSVMLGKQTGMPDDCWSQLPVSERTANMQLSVMSSRVGDLIANGQDACLFGDNLVIDLDISESNLPIGSVLQVGDSRLEVTPEPHTGCAQYQHRFGAAALRYISQPIRREQKLRGVYMRAIKDGIVAVGDQVTVLSRPD